MTAELQWGVIKDNLGQFILRREAIGERREAMGDEGTRTHRRCYCLEDGAEHLLFSGI